MKVVKQAQLFLEFTCEGAAVICPMDPKKKPQNTLPPKYQAVNNLVPIRNKPYISQWYHTTLFSSVKQTLLQAINNGYLSAYLNLTIDMIKNHIPPSLITAKGHMHQSMNNLRYTKQQ